MLTSVYVFIVKYFSALPPNPPGRFAESAEK